MVHRIVVPGVRGSAGAGDPELQAVDEEFRQLLNRYRPVVKGTRATGRRFMFADSVGVRGEIEVTEGASPHPFFAAGLRYPVLARFSNSVSSDDVAPDLRGLSLMFLDPEDPGDPGLSPFNLTMTTGRRLFVPHAAAFTKFVFGGDEAHEELAREFPGMREALWDGVREAVSFVAYHYYSKAPRLHVTDEGPELIRYRVLATEHAPDAGFHDPGGRRFPPAPPKSLERDPADDRLPSLLWNDVRSRIAEGGFTMLLQVQRHPLGDDPDANRALLDASREWPENRYPYRTLATVRFDGLLDGITGEELVFHPVVAPDGLGIALARTPYETASINHLRALAYGPAHAARSRLASAPKRPRPRKITLTVRESPAEAGPERRTVCVVGAGASGLTVARELERLGHRAVVLESAGEVAGKAASVRVDGRAYDLGAHICTTRYTELMSLACELGVETEPATPALVYDTARRRADPVPFPAPEVIGRYRHLRDEYFPHAGRTGLVHSGAALARPATHLLRELGLNGLITALGTGYTSAGYGPLTGDIPALYFVTYAEHTGLIPANHSLDRRSGTFTIKGGFARLWRQVAEELTDVRVGARIESIERRPDGVTVRTGSGVVEADDLVLTVPLDRVLPLLATPTDLERHVASRIRTIDYRTVVCRVSGVPRHGFFLFPGPAEGLVAYHSRYADQDVCTCYCYGAEGLDEDALVARTAESLERIGGRLEEVDRVVRWPFMPHFGTADVASGILDRIERSQGVERTYHAGSLLAFELIEANIAYARELVRRFFTTPAERPVIHLVTGGATQPGAVQRQTVPPPAVPRPREHVAPPREKAVPREHVAPRLEKVAPPREHVAPPPEEVAPPPEEVVPSREDVAREPVPAEAVVTGDGEADAPVQDIADELGVAEVVLAPETPAPGRPRTVVPAMPCHRAADEIRTWLVCRVAGHLGRPEGEVDPCRPIDEHGLDSLAMAELHTELADWLGRPVPMTLLYRLPTLDALARYLEGAAR
ncbi:FAD-dependent oxidoreductase [Sphaerisporangium sp. B11E5]|uniref:FAD-dependent oxidoreductase n=1 Tax=Sphaerisporangium sp. B11E5 TaxID=3153563 RepID=UPI00325F43A7